MIIAMEFIEDEILVLSQLACIIVVYSIRLFIIFSAFLNSAKKEIVPENNTVAM